ncbi:Fic family protein [Patescibacteria group bacterium]|nr:Fic family protein [Patescibacteria group bacterium]
MNDTIQVNKRQQKILRLCVFAQKSLSSSEIFDGLETDTSLVTIKRDLGELFEYGYLIREGAGAGTKYTISTLGRINTIIDIEKYSEIETDKRFTENHYNFDFFDEYPNTVFSQKEIEELEETHRDYLENTKSVSETLHKKELERFVIELSWKSSRIEGNTYTLLDTERLIRDGIKSEKNTDEEATMILNHKKAFEYILEHRDSFRENLSFKKIQEIHKILVQDLNISSEPRTGRVGITGSNYLPLDNSYQIIEAVDSLCKRIEVLETSYDKALLALIGLSYLQTFEDGNKRIARFITNAILLAYGYAPLSYRSVDEEDYREAMLAFYETQSVVAVKEIFIGQYLFSTKNYSL